MSSGNAREGSARWPDGRRRKPARSLATLLTASYACSAFALVLISTAILYWGLVRSFENQNNRSLLVRIEQLRVLLRGGEDDHASLRWEVELEWQDHQSPPAYLRVLNPRDDSLMETSGMCPLLPPEAFPLPVDAGSEPTQGVRVKSESGRPFHVMAAAAPVGAAGTETRIIQVAIDLSGQEKLLARYRWLLGFVLGGAALVSLWSGYRIAQKGMRPLQEIVTITQRIRSSTLNERVRVARLPAELDLLADNFNDMLDRLEESFVHLSRFSADLAHEFRTPLNNLRVQAEVSLCKARTTEEYEEVLASSLEEYDNLSRIVDGLLFVAQAEWSEMPIEREPVELLGELRAILGFYEPVGVEKGLRLGIESDGELWTGVDRVLFQRAVSNLVSNAVAFTPTGGTILLRAVQQDTSTRIEVSDTGIGIPAEHLPHIFDRFYRVERARSRTSGGVGLGLSIVKTIMDLHGGSVEIFSEPGRGTRMALIFPQMTKS